MATGVQGSYEGDISNRYGDTQITKTARNQAPHVTHFLMEVIPVLKQMIYPFQGIIPSIEVNGKEVSIPRRIGRNITRPKQARSDRKFAPSGITLKRKTLTWQFYDLDFEIKDGEMEEDQINYINEAVVDITCEMANRPMQVVLRALAGLKQPAIGSGADNKTITIGTNTTDADQDAILGVVNHHVFGKITGGVITRDNSDNEKAYKINPDKMRALRNMMARGATSANGRPIFVTSYNALEGLDLSGEVRNRDFNPAAGMDLTAWDVNPNVLGLMTVRLADQLAGEGLPVNAAVVNTLAAKTIQRSYCFGGRAMRVTRGGTLPMHKMRIYDANDDHSVHIRYALCYGADVVQPKGVGGMDCLVD